MPLYRVVTEYSVEHVLEFEADNEEEAENEASMDADWKLSDFANSDFIHREVTLLK